MKSDNTVLLSILDHIEQKNGEVSQRDLSEQLGISLGYINSYLRGLIRKGLLKVKKAPKKRFLYYITPMGFLEKAGLTLEYMRYMVGQYGQIRQRIRTTVQNLNKVKKQSVAIYGTTELSEIFLLALLENGVQPVAVFSEKETLESETWMGRPVSLLKEITSMEFECLLVGLWPEENNPSFQRLFSCGVALEKLYFPNGTQPQLRTQVVFVNGMADAPGGEDLPAATSKPLS